MLTPRQVFFIFAAVGPAASFAFAQFWAPGIWLFVGVVALVMVGLRDVTQTKRAILRQYPILGHGRYLAEHIRPEIQQYFVESDTNGAPFSRATRAVVYQRAKGDLDKLPFGTQLDVYAPGHEFLAHSIHPKPPAIDSRVSIGGPACTRPYSASVLNVSAMSFGALSAAAVTALSRGAAAGGFAVNTGEGGVSPYHLDGGADLIWQIGTGYFGCRAEDGAFDPEMFATTAALPAVKMIEIKLSQGAKPGHGGILPAAKVTPEIAEIRKVPLGTTVLSPPAHTAFSTVFELMHFVRELRMLSDGKPIGFKLCVGAASDVDLLIDAMHITGVTPDFITIDGSEGGTGAAPPELSDFVGIPMRDAINIVNTALLQNGLRSKVRLIASGKVATGFDIVRALALGADACGSARAMMLALGCIQARRCHTNECPVGVATQDPNRAKALVPSNKAGRVTGFHRETVAAFLELVGAAGCEHPSEIGLEHVSRRVDQTQVRSYAEIYGASMSAPVR